MALVNRCQADCDRSKRCSKALRRGGFRFGLCCCIPDCHPVPVPSKGFFYSGPRSMSDNDGYCGKVVLWDSPEKRYGRRSQHPRTKGWRVIRDGDGAYMKIPSLGWLGIAQAQEHCLKTRQYKA